MASKPEREITLKSDGWLLRQAKETALSVSRWPASHRRNIDFEQYVDSKSGRSAAVSDDKTLNPQRKR